MQSVTLLLGHIASLLNFFKHNALRCLDPVLLDLHGRNDEANGGIFALDLYLGLLMVINLLPIRETTIALHDHRNFSLLRLLLQQEQIIAARGGHSPNR